MLKFVGLLKRRPDMTTEAFRAYYEGQHAKVGEATLPGRAKRYQRRYLKPVIDADGNESGFDVIVEMWFENEKGLMEAVLSMPGTPAGDYIVSDEEKLFDRSKTQFYMIDEERETDLEALPALSISEVEKAFGVA